MSGFGRVHEEGGRARGGEGRGEFAADVPRFAHARNDQSAAAVEKNADGFDEIVADAVGDHVQGFGFLLQDGLSESKGCGGIELIRHVDLREKRLEVNL